MIKSGFGDWMDRLLRMSDVNGEYVA
jgi:hypothetical protein